MSNSTHSRIRSHRSLSQYIVIGKRSAEYCRVLRIIEDADRLTQNHTTLEKTDLLNVKQRDYFNVLMIIFRAQNGLLPDYLCRHCNQLHDVQPYQSRNNNIFRPLHYTSGASQNSLVYKGAAIYNEMVKKTKANISASESDYRKAVTTFVKDCISSHRIL